MRVVILTGSEFRHEYFRKRISSDSRIEVLATYCEGQERSLEARTLENSESSALELQHAQARKQSERDFFGDFVSSVDDASRPRFIAKGAINDDEVVAEIVGLSADLLVCYGSSLIKSALLDLYRGRFLNVHLGLSPYYRGSGTNVWPLINGEPDMVGATFMHIDSGIDTGAIIHQIRGDIYLGDSPHSIGNRLIGKMTETYADLIVRFRDLEDMPQPDSDGALYLERDFDGKACRVLYDNFRGGMIERFLSSGSCSRFIVKNRGLA